MIKTGSHGIQAEEKSLERRTVDTPKRDIFVH